MNHKMTQQLNWQRDDFKDEFQAWEGDLWERKRLGKQLTRYVDRLQCGAVLALDARWGEGKTWFVRHWKKHLEDQSHQVVYLDAFANDYLDDPFLTIAAEISHALKDADEIADTDIQDFNSKTASVLISLATVMPLIAAKAGLHWVGLGGAGEALQEVYKEGKDVYDTASEEIANKAKEQIEKKIENHHIEKQTIQDFKQELAQLANKLDKPLVFIIDELDRCRPDFAIRLIERIKHFFDIKNIVFVLVMDKTQFSKVICHNYGYNENLGEEYLDKFIDFEFQLSPTPYPYMQDYVLSQKLLIDLGIDRDKAPFIGIDKLFYYLVKYEKISLRKAKKIANRFGLYCLDDNIKNQILLIFLVFKNKKIEKTSDFFRYILDFFTKIYHSEPYFNIKKKDEIEGDIFKKMSERFDIYERISILEVLYDRFCEFENDRLTEDFIGVNLLPSNREQERCNFMMEWNFYIHSGLTFNVLV